jgi:hypothetical protein
VNARDVRPIHEIEAITHALPGQDKDNKPYNQGGRSRSDITSEKKEISDIE